MKPVNGSTDREDVNAILSGVFDINVALSRIDKNLETITKWLQEDDDEEEEEEDDPGDSPS